MMMGRSRRSRRRSRRRRSSRRCTSEENQELRSDLDKMIEKSSHLETANQELK
jgi:hypothetical protein